MQSCTPLDIAQQCCFGGYGVTNGIRVYPTVVHMAQCEDMVYDTCGPGWDMVVEMPLSGAFVTPSRIWMWSYSGL